MKNIKFNFKKIVNIFVIMCIIFSTFFRVYSFNTKYVSDKTYKKYELKIIEKIKSSENKLSYLVKYNNDKFVLNIYKPKYSKENIDLNKYSEYTYGDYICIKGKLTIPELLNNLYEFDYKKYLNSKNIYAIINTYSKPQFKYNKKDLLSLIYSFKAYISSIIKREL